MTAAVDTFANWEPLPGCFDHAAAITTSDTVPLGFVTRAVYVGGAGDIAAVVNGATVVFKAVPVGTVLKIRASQINATNTTATNLVALW